MEKHAHVVIGVSGGIDSLVLLHLLRMFNRRYRPNWRVTAVHIDPGFPKANIEGLRQNLEMTETDHIIVSVDVRRRISKSANKCFICAQERHRRLIEIAETIDTFNIALAHHQDDVVETVLLNMFYAGRLSTLMPRQPVVQGRFTIIRPLYYLSKTQIKNIADTAGIRAFSAPCPYYKNSRREKIRSMLHDLKQKNPDISGNIFHSIFNVRRQYLPQ
ncbi:MAG: tRNA 2-thiocytidine biosynthesis protein TtcA [candidate division WOR-3 bacterium]|nr:MAG: tRNA 2-thiocytidine biosynthesis protein TtcA [candidate division WOR-3 bacterium]